MIGLILVMFLMIVYILMLIEYCFLLGFFLSYFLSLVFMFIIFFRVFMVWFASSIGFALFVFLYPAACVFFCVLPGIGMIIFLCCLFFFTKWSVSMLFLMFFGMVFLLYGNCVFVILMGLFFLFERLCLLR